MNDNKERTVTRFAFRFELPSDYWEALFRAVDLCRKQSTHFLPIQFEYTTFEGVLHFATGLTLEEVRDILRAVPDGHVMLESLNFADKFTGERWHLEWAAQ